MEAKLTIPEFLSGGGEMGQRIRDYDWSSTPLGPVENWPQSLRTCVRIMLTSQQPIWIGWGKQLIKLYNDPYRVIVGGKHPGALGAPASVVWKDIWREIGPMLRAVLEKDESTYEESRLLIMERNGYPEETYYTFSYTPIPGDDGGTAGMICFNADNTGQIIGERQLQTLARLGAGLRDCGSYDEAVRRALAALEGNRYDFPFALYYAARPEGSVLTHSTALESPEAHVPRVLGPDEGPLAMALQQASLTRREQIVTGIRHLLGPMPAGAWEEPTDKAVVLPIYGTGAKEATGFLVAGINPYRLPNESFFSFCSLVADQLTTSFADIHVLELERGRAQALAEIDRAKTLFFSNISHEFRTPLTLLLGPLEDMLNDHTLIHTNRYRLGVAYRNALRMQKLVNTLLEFSRIEAGRLEGHFRRVDIAALTLDLASTFRSAIEKAGMQLVTGAGPIGSEVYVDPELWERIILNLVSNALKYSEQGEISVEVAQEGEQILVRVADTGVGIPADQLERIFDRFHRVENSGGRSMEGTGIGLAMVRELVRLHQGIITVSSTLGNGSVFTIAIPTGSAHLPAERVMEIPEDDAVGPHHAEAYVMEAMKWVEEEGHPAVGGGEWGGLMPGSEQSDGHTKRHVIVLADDNADMREYVRRLLSSRFTVITAKDGEEALEKVKEHKPDLVLTDVMMPKLDGFGLLKQIRQLTGLKDTPVILLSARAGEDAKIEGLDAGADDYLVKPFGARELLARVEGSIKIAQERSAALREYANKLERTVDLRTEELRQLNLSLERSNEDLQQFAHVASHDLKEPVRKVRTFTGRLLEEYGGVLPPEAKVYLGKVQHATSRMVRMIEGVLTYSILNSDGHTISEIDLNEVFAQIEIDLEVAIAEKGAIIQRDELPVIQGAPILIYQLFYNLVNNALKFSANEHKPLIVISFRVSDEVGKRIANILVRDNGIGFDQKQAGRIFEAFARLNSKDKFEGTGLGLALCKKIAERHHGSISATGVVGQGAEFEVRLPLIQTETSI